jgi:hypothetical protein
MVVVPYVVADEKDGVERLLDVFLSESGISDKASVYTGEMIEHFLDKPTLGQSFREGITLAYRPIQKQLSRAVYAVEVQREGRGIDWYIFLRKESDVWKLEAVRSLALTGPIHVEIQRLGRMQHRSVEQERTYQNLILTVASDKELKSYLRTHSKELQILVTLALSGKVTEATAKAKALSLGSVELAPENQKIVQIVVGGIINNVVGFMHIPPGIAAPAMDPSEYIYIEHVIGNWYLYKTT